MNNYPPGIKPGDEDPFEHDHATQCEGCFAWFNDDEGKDLGEHGWMCEPCETFFERYVRPKLEKE